MIRIKNLTKKYGQTVALDNVTAEFEEKGFVFINGMSGSGKTTLMNLLSGLDAPTSGEIYYNGNDITKYSREAFDEYRNLQIGIVFQNFNLIDDLTVEENLLLPLEIQDVSETKKNQLVEETLSYVGLEGYANRKGNELSAGQRQRVAIARAIIKRPKVIFADEATGNLDPKNSEQILELFNDISKRCLVVLISHNATSARKYADKIITLDEGKICEETDNRQIKELYLEPYEVFINGHEYKNQTCLEGFDIKEEIKNLNNKLGYKLDKYSFHTTISRKDKQMLTNKTWIEVGKTEIKSLPFNVIAKFIANLMKRQSIKNILVICLVTFITLLFFVMCVLSGNDYYMALTKAVNNESSSLFPVKMSVLTEEAVVNDIYRGEPIYERLREITDSDDIIEYIGEVTMYKDTEMYNTAVFKYSELFDTITISGVWPREGDEIAISSEFAESKDIGIGDHIADDISEYVVVGIYDFSENMTGYNAVVSTEYRNNSEEKYITLQACDILNSVSVERYVSEIATIGNIENIKEDELVWGRMPSKDNEIVISTGVMEENQMSLETGFITMYRLPNLQAEKYNNEYDEFVNMYAFLGQKIEVVGVYSSDNTDYGDILVNAASYKGIHEFYREYLSFESLYVRLDGDIYDVISLMAEKDIYLCDNTSSYIYAIQDFFCDMADIMKVILCILLLMVIFVIVSFLSYNVKEYSKTVGIYKSLGIKDLDIVKLFVYYNVQISIISILISNIALQCVICFLNEEIGKTLKENAFEVFVVNNFSCVILSSMILLISVAATVIPVFGMVRKESVTLINRSDV